MSSARRARRPSVFTLVVVGVVALVLVLGAAAAWQVWGSTRSAHNRAARALASFPASCDSQATDAVIGVLTIDAIGVREPIARGTDNKALGSGAGWYATTGQPGQAGNFALAGYRITHGAPLERLLELNKGDVITVDSCSGSFRYAVEVAPRDLTVHADDSWVLDAVPGHAGQIPTDSLLTITAEQDLVPTADRSVLFATLVH